MEPYNTCQHGVDIERNCRLCDLILQKELNRIRPKKERQGWLWLVIFGGLFIWFIVLVWRLGR